jgi:hypothetical protein
MVKPLTSQNSWLALTGQLDHYRSGRAGRLSNTDDMRRMGNFEIDISGSMSKLIQTSTFTPGKGIATVPPTGTATVATPSDPATTKAIDTRGAPVFSQAELDAIREQNASGFIAAVPASVEIHYTPIGAEPQSVEGLGFMPDLSDRNSQVDYVKSQVARAEELAQIEGQLRQEYGEPVKIAFDPLSGTYAMLRPGQNGYGNVQSAQDVYRQVLSDMPKMGLGLSTRA